LFIKHLSGGQGKP